MIFSPLRPHSYDLIMIDPPWRFSMYSARGEAKSPQAQYACMSLDAIARLPVRALAAKDCVLWLWATHPMLPHAIEVMRQWGFNYSTSGVWIKRTRTGKMGFGPGFVLRTSSEPFLIGKIGNPVFAKNVRTSFDGLAREHSRKPEEGYRHAMRLAPDAQRRADIFSRERRKGWDSWGDEAGKFDAERAA